MSKSSKDKEDAKRLRERVEEMTGEWYCVSGQHRVKGEVRLHRGRRVCPACYQRITAFRSAKRGT
jgi:hypothetical protein